jgi:hypothetical protein
MEFESARDLKEEALARFVRPQGGRLAAVGGRLKRSSPRLTAAMVQAVDFLPGSFGLTESLGLTGFVPGSSVGLGVAVSPETGACKLAVRYPWLDRTRAPHLAELTDFARGEVDVEWTGRITATTGNPYAALRDRCRPLTIGSSVAHDRGTAGTLCAFVQRGGGAPELLSCNHVLAGCDRAEPNAAILQPGPADGTSTAKNLIGRLAYAVPLEEHANNYVDCAVATLDTGVDGDYSTLLGYGDLQGLVSQDWYSDSAKRQDLAKIGRTTFATEGRVTALSFDSEVDFPIGPRLFTDMIEVKGHSKPFGAGGDSGSLVFTIADRLGVGMIIAVAENGTTYMTRLDTILSSLGARLVGSYD